MALEGFKRVAVIKFESNNSEWHYALYDDDISAGDSVLLSGNYELKHGTVADIISPDEAKNRMGNKKIQQEVICKIDISAYKRRVEKRKVKAKLKSAITKRKKELDKEKLDEYYASIDLEYAKMLNQYNSYEV